MLLNPDHKISESPSTSNRAFRKLATKTLLFILLLAVFDYLIGALVDSQIRSGKIDTMSNIEYTQRLRPDVLIVGASSAELGYNTKLIEQNTGLTALNIATGSVSSSYVYIVLSEVLKKHKPKVVIYDVPDSDLMGITSNAAIEKLSYLYGEDREVSQLIARSMANSAFLSLNAYKYRIIIKNLLRPMKTDPSDNFKYIAPDGSKGLDYDVSKKRQTYDDAYMNHYYSTRDTSSITYDSFWKIVNLCEDMRIYLIVVLSPKYPWSGKYYHNSLVAETQNEVNQYRYVTLLNISPEHYPAFRQKQFYKDVVHLNGPGASLLSSIVSAQVLKLDVFPNK